MRRLYIALCTAAVTAMAAETTATFAQPPRAIVYVSPTGNDNNDGLSADAPFQTFQRAQKEWGRNGVSTIALMTGVYHLSQPLLVKNTSPHSPGPQVLTAAAGNAPVLDGGGTTGFAIDVNGDDIVVNGLTVQNFTQSGIMVLGARRASITNNHIRNITSTGWNQAGILGMHYVPDMTVSGNTIEHVGYAGIQFAGEADLSNPHIVGNTIIDSCKTVADCGAIYLLGRTPKSGGAVIRDNRIEGYGPVKNETKAIYLDDGLSGATVSGNTISGRGTYAFQVHGGGNNVIEGNVVTPTPGQPAMLYQSINDKEGTTMAGNVFAKNQIAGSRDRRSMIHFDGKSVPPVLTSGSR
jgi:hypothetical protein